jgi:hypothetical protein|tara:strand:+ start:124 stop:471 length:348 start_codon:yes stop_codon:yes gene_type:complete
MIKYHNSFRCTEHPAHKRSTGFQITFANGNTVSVQWGEGTYSSSRRIMNQEHRVDSTNRDEAMTVEIAAWHTHENMDTWHAFPNGDAVAGWKTPEEVLEFMTFVANNTLTPRPKD